MNEKPLSNTELEDAEHKAEIDPEDAEHQDPKLSKNDAFVEHLIEHIIEWGYPRQQAEKMVSCQICGKKIDEIYEYWLKDPLANIEGER